MLLIVLALSLASPDPSGLIGRIGHTSSEACGDSVQFSRLRVGTLLMAGRDPRMPIQLRAMAEVDPAHLRLLRGDQDAATCRALRREVLANRPPDRITGRPWIVTIYEADGYFFAVVSPDEARAQRNSSARVPVMIGENRGTSIVVFDRNLSRVIEVNA